MVAVSGSTALARAHRTALAEGCVTSVGASGRHRGPIRSWWAGWHLGAGPCRPTCRETGIARPSRAPDAVTVLEGRRAHLPRAGPAKAPDRWEPRSSACGVRARRGPPAQRTRPRPLTASRGREFRRSPSRGSRRRRPCRCCGRRGRQPEALPNVPGQVTGLDSPIVLDVWLECTSAGGGGREGAGAEPPGGARGRRQALDRQLTLAVER
jgi:hypothetical protein